MAGAGAKRNRGGCGALSPKQTAHGRWWVGPPNSEPEDVVHFVVIVQISLAEVEPRGSCSGRRILGIALLERNSRLRGLVRFKNAFLRESAQHRSCRGIEVSHG